MSEAEPYLLDRKRAAAFLGVTGKTIWVWCKQGKMPEPAIEMPRKKYWSRDSLRAMQEKESAKVEQSSTS